MLLFLIICSAITSLMVPILYVQKARLETRTAILDSLLHEWQSNREKRLLWKNNHSGRFDNFNFNDPEYQELWDREIGSQAVFLLALERHKMRVPAFSSWCIYVQEKHEAEEEFD